ncbi:MAG: hypothetical protein AABM67_03705 [Acidobacteriota bacterium]
MSDKSSNGLTFLSDFLSKVSGKIMVVISFITATLALVKLIRGDSTLAVIIVLLVSAGGVWLVAIYIYVVKEKSRQTTVKTGIATIAKPVYSPRVRAIALGVVFAVPILCTFGLLYSKKTSHGTRIGFWDLVTSERITLAGTVLTAGGEPADDAVVVLRLKSGDQTQVADQGRFEFTQVDISQETSKVVELNVHWRAIETTQAVDLSTAPRDRLVFRLPAGDPPFKVEYRVFGGYAIDFLVKGEVDKQWEKILGEQPYIVVNDVFKNLQAIQTGFSEPFRGWYFLVNPKRNDRSDERVDKELAQRNKNKPLLPLYKDSDFPALVSYIPTRDRFLSVFNAENKWNIRFLSSKWTPKVEDIYRTDAFYFWKLAEASDLKELRARDPRNQALAFYSFVSRNYMPPGFILLAMIVGEEGCGWGNNFWLVAPEPQLRVALIENISDRPIRIGSFLFRGSDPKRLRTREDDQSSLKSGPAKPENMFPLQYLKPREKLLIPLELFLNYRDETFPPFANEGGNQDTTELTKSTVVEFPIYTQQWSGYAFLPVKTSDLLRILRSSKDPPALDKDFIYGPSIAIDALEVDGTNYPFRPLNTSSIVLVGGGGEVGSCPYVYTHSAENDLWVDEGTILYRFKGKMNEATQKKTLSRFDGKIVIKEKDPETSFIDAVSILITTNKGEERLVYPRNKQLRFEDGQYMTLRQGDQVVIEFDLPKGVAGSKYVLIAKGYYVPY